MPKSFYHFWKNKYFDFCEYFSFLLTWDTMRAKTSKRYSSLTSLLNPFKLFLNFLLSGPHKRTVLKFWVFDFSWYGVFVRRPCHNYLRTYWADSLQISVMASPGPYPKTFFSIFEKNAFSNFSGFFFFAFVLTMLTWDPMGAKNFKTLLFPQITFESIQTFSEYTEYQNNLEMSRVVPHIHQMFYRGGPN